MSSINCDLCVVGGRDIRRCESAWGITFGGQSGNSVRSQCTNTESESEATRKTTEADPDNRDECNGDAKNSTRRAAG